MNSSVEESYKLQLLSFLIGSIITCVAALMINGFIVTVTVADWMKQRPLTVTDQILTSLGIARIAYHSDSLLYIFCNIFFTESHIISQIIYFFFSLSFYANIWLVNLLSTVFCLKICNFHNVFFIRLKVMILQRVVRLIIISVLVSICCTSIYYLIYFTEIPKNSLNTTYNEEKGEIDMYLFLFVDSVPFLLFFVSSFLLTIYLCHHVYRMRGDGAVTGQLDIYYKTITFSIFSSLTCACYFVAYVTIWFYEESLDVAGIYFLLNVFPTLHSMYLIYITARLRTCLSAVLQHGAKFWLSCRCCYPQAGGPVETITQRP